MTNDRRNIVNRVADNIKDVGDTVFDSVQQGIEVAESATMKTVDQTAEAIKEWTETDNQES